MTIRRVPEDFVVEELLREDVTRALGAGSAARRFAVYELTKTSLTTEGAAARLAAALGVPAGRVSYAGLKDKHARTVQHVSVGPIEGAGGGGAARPEVGGEGWSARLLGWSKESAAAAWIRRNRFTITVRGLTPERCERMDTAAEQLSLGAVGEVRRLLLVNYFGDQRFGSARHGAGFAARHLVRGDFEGALRLAIGTSARKDTGKRRVLAKVLESAWGRWDEVLAGTPRCPERGAVEVLARGGGFREAFGALPYFLQQMCVEAYQAHLWNSMARRMAACTVGPGSQKAIVAPDRFGELVFPFPAMVGVGLRSMELPLPGPGTRPVGSWREAADTVMREEGIAFDALVIPGMRRPAFGEAWRPLFVLVERFGMSAPEADEMSGGVERLKRVVTFELPRGAYATVLLRALGE